jgi:hypothetical protein
MTEYQIVVSGELDVRWMDWLNNMERSISADKAGRPITVLTGPLADQSELRGLLIKIWDLNLELVSLFQLDCASQQKRNQT